MNLLYPVFLKLEGKSCVVVGGGEVATRKVMALQDAKALVTVISPRLTQTLKLMFQQKDIIYKPYKYKHGDIKNAFLVIGATDDRQVNEQIFKDAQQRQILVNIVDVPECCNFYVPSICNRGDLKIAISTNGLAPALARFIRESLEKLIPSKIAADIQKLARLRADQRKAVPDDSRLRGKLARKEARIIAEKYFA
jgi:precorrin-2 dehydrogenase/sirohydrochlorin ferrochelatase